MKTSTRTCWFRILPVLLLSVGIGGCDPDSEDTLTGTWVAYSVLLDGSPAPVRYSIGGAILIFNNDGSGTAIGPDPAEAPNVFTWSRVGGTLTMADGGSPDDIPITITGDHLTMTDVTNSHTLTVQFQRHTGSGVLLGTWDLISKVDQKSGDPDLSFPDGIAFRFDDAGIVTVLVGDDAVDAAEYFTDGPVLTIGPLSSPFEVEVFAVVGTTLYLFEFESDGEDDRMWVKRWEKR